LNGQGFRENAGWTGEYARGDSAQPPPRVPRAAWAEAEDVRGEPAVGARALLQVFRSREDIGEEVRLDHRFAIGRDEDCGLRLKWDGVSKRHVFLEAFHLPPPGCGGSEGSRRSGRAVGWFLTGNGSNGTFINRCYSLLVIYMYLLLADADCLFSNCPRFERCCLLCIPSSSSLLPPPSFLLPPPSFLLPSSFLPPSSSFMAT
jgi:hypothetical protein